MIDRNEQIESPRQRKNFNGIRAGGIFHKLVKSTSQAGWMRQRMPKAHIIQELLWVLCCGENRARHPGKRTRETIVAGGHPIGVRVQ